jgi:hypothetical protein
MLSNFRTNTRSASEYTKSAPAKPLHNWRDQRPSNGSDLDSVTGGVGTADNTGLDLLPIQFLYRTVPAVGLRFNGALCTQ